MTKIDRLEKAVLDLHGCASHHVGSVSVHETFKGQTAWRGVVEIFEVHDHLKAKEAYAWSYKNDSGETRHVAILGVPPVDSPHDAVKAYLAAQILKAQH